MIHEHYERERRPDGTIALFRWTDLELETYGKKKLDEMIKRWRESVKRGGLDGKRTKPQANH